MQDDVSYNYTWNNNHNRAECDNDYGGEMIVYKYDENGYYTGVHNCQQCPKTGGWLYPPRYLTSAPPEGEWKIAQADGKKWKLVDDNRGREVWEKSSGNYCRCETMDIPETHTLVKPPDEMYHVFDGTKWKVDSAKKSAYNEQVQIQADEKLIYDEMRKQAIAALGNKLKIVTK